MTDSPAQDITKYIGKIATENGYRTDARHGSNYTRLTVMRGEQYAHIIVWDASPSRTVAKASDERGEFGLSLNDLERGLRAHNLRSGISGPIQGQGIEVA